MRLRGRINLDPITATFAITSAPTSNIKLDALSVCEQIEISLAKVRIVNGIRLE
jgi:hypothetical protein